MLYHDSNYSPLFLLSVGCSQHQMIILYLRKQPAKISPWKRLLNVYFGFPGLVGLLQDENEPVLDWVDSAAGQILGHANGWALCMVVAYL